MKRSKLFSLAATLALCGAAVSASGCGTWKCMKNTYQPVPPPATLGSVSDQIWQMQEERAEATEFIVYNHEFKMNTARLNDFGREHIKQIAHRLQQGQQFPVVIERSVTTAKPETEYKYPIHYNPELDLLRREVIVRALTAFGVQDADERCSVAPSFTPGFKATEAENAYYQSGYGNQFGGGGGFGGGFGR